ncbi:glycosyltransferase [Aeromonas sp. 600282]|uniref:glycosyltransferase n=1 Tax=Aeromonas sp. 600282 TaxID=2712027 RepID=UPI003B9DDC0E
MKNYIILTRFSVIMKSTLSAWRISSNSDIKDVVNRVFEEKRLRSRTNIFTRHSLPIIDVASKTRNIKHIVVTSTLLPDWCKKELDESSNKYDWLDIVYVDPDTGYNLNREISKAADKLSKKLAQENIIIASLRLDDDDLLSSNYFETIDQYQKSEFVDYCISTPRGYRGLYDGDKYLCFSYENIPNNAYGMAIITSYSLKNSSFTSQYLFPPGTHIDMDKRIPVILDGRKHTFLRTMGRDNDGFSLGSSYAYEDELSQIRKKHFPNPISETEEVESLFGVTGEKISIFEYLSELVTFKNNNIIISYNKNKEIDIEMAFYLIDLNGNKIITTNYSDELHFSFPAKYHGTHQVIAFCKKGDEREKRVVKIES